MISGASGASGSSSNSSAAGASSATAAGAAAGAPLPALEWKFSQVFGERAIGEEVQEVDIISAIEFDKTGEHLATGDRGGRVVLFERTDGRERATAEAPNVLRHFGAAAETAKAIIDPLQFFMHSMWCTKPRRRRELEMADSVGPRHPEFRYSTEFQSHEPEFDYLKSLEIEEKINKIRWCPTSNAAQFLLSTNDKTIKLWKVTEKKLKQVKNLNVDPGARGNGSSMTNNLVLNPKGIAPRLSMNGVAVNRPTTAINPDFVFPPGGIPSLHLPAVWSNETVLLARCRRVYANAHAYHINSISNNSDCETYISADDLRINLWNLEVSDQSFNIVDIKPTNMEDLTEVITSAEFHPTHCNMLAYSSSKGSIRLIDMRQSALCDRHSKLFEEPEPPGQRSFFTEIIASISDIKFARGGRYILSRDYMTLKLWDVNMESAPVASFKVHEYLRPKLCDLYENDSIFDKFECCLSGDGMRVATGSYSNLFRVFGVTPGSEESSMLEASKTPNRRLMTPPSKPVSRLANLARVRRDNRRGSESPGAEMNGGVHDFASKLLHLAWHPASNVIACAASNSLYMYYA